MNEIWKPIEDYEGSYEISNMGNVRSLNRVCGKMPNGSKRIVKGRNLIPIDNGNGYLVIHLKKNGMRRMRYIHRLVAEAFIPKPAGCNTVNHIDYNKKNNKADNLEWCTQRENVIHSRHLMCKPRENCKKTNTGEKYISFIKREGIFRVNIRKYQIDKRFRTIEEATQYKNEVLNEINYTV